MSASTYTSKSLFDVMSNDVIAAAPSFINTT